MTISEREAHELLHPLGALPVIEARKPELRPKSRRHPLRLAVVVAVLGILGTGSAVAAIERFSGGNDAQRERQMTREHQEVKEISGASDGELRNQVQERSGGSIPPAAVDPAATRQGAKRQLAIGFPDELRFYDANHRLVQVTKCSWPHPNPDCIDPVEAIKKYPGAKLVETWSNGKPVAGGG